MMSVLVQKRFVSISCGVFCLLLSSPSFAQSETTAPVDQLSPTSAEKEKNIGENPDTTETTDTKNSDPKESPEVKEQVPPPPKTCIKANAEQVKEVLAGNEKREKFLDHCARETGKSPLCLEVIRPNPFQESVEAFHCTYGEEMPHQLIHPDEGTWKFGVEAIKILQDLEKIGIKNCGIYNWWRPEPYNKNVQGSPRRHPFGVSVDVIFCSKEDVDKAFLELCKMKEAGRVRAIGYYGNNNIHLGVGDAKANNWGKYCIEVLPPKKEEKKDEKKDGEKKDPTKQAATEKAHGKKEKSASKMVAPSKPQAKRESH